MQDKTLVDVQKMLGTYVDPVEEYMQTLQWNPVAEVDDVRFQLYVVREFSAGEPAMSQIPTLPNTEIYAPNEEAVSVERYLLFTSAHSKEGMTGFFFVVPKQHARILCSYDHKKIQRDVKDFFRTLPTEATLKILKGSSLKVHQGSSAQYDGLSGEVRFYTHKFYSHASKMWVFRSVPLIVTLKNVVAHEVGHSLDPNITEYVRYIASKQEFFNAETRRLNEKLQRGKRFTPRDKRIADELLEFAREYVRMEEKMETTAWNIGKSLLPEELHASYDEDREIVETAHRIEAEKQLHDLTFLHDTIQYGW